MIQQLPFLILLVGGLFFVLFLFLDYAMFDHETDCKHEHQATFDSYNKKMCIDCGKEFSTKEDKK
jgi:hypothetical protein